MQKINDFGEKIGGAKKDLWKERNMILKKQEKHLNSQRDRNYKSRKTQICKTRQYLEKDQCRRNVRKRISEINRFLAERNASLYLS